MHIVLETVGCNKRSALHRLPAGKAVACAALNPPYDDVSGIVREAMHNLIEYQKPWRPMHREG